MSENEYTKEARVRKLQKLRDLADHPATEGPLAEAARDQYRKLIEKWEIDPDLIEDEHPQDWDFRIPPGCEMILAKVARHMELDIWKPRKFRAKIRATKDEAALFGALIDLALSARKRKIKEQKKALQSFVVGMLEQAYPVGPAKCPKCAKQEEYHWNGRERRYQCVACGYTSRRHPSMNLDEAALQEGRDEANRLRPGRLLSQ